MRRLLGLPVKSPTHCETDPASLSVLGYYLWKDRGLVRWNGTAHLWERELDCGYGVGVV